MLAFAGCRRNFERSVYGRQCQRRGAKAALVPARRRPASTEAEMLSAVSSARLAEVACEITGCKRRAHRGLSAHAAGAGGDQAPPEPLKQRRVRHGPRGHACAAGERCVRAIRRLALITAAWQA